MAYTKVWPEGWKDNEDGGTYIDAAGLNKMEQGIIDAHDYMARTDNPHNVTKEQVGLGNVPDVTTNDQAPTYTVPAALTALQSGEKLSVAMGKLARALLVLEGKVDGVKGSAETAYRSGNVEITAANLGLGNVDNTADADKPISDPASVELGDVSAAQLIYAFGSYHYMARTDNPHNVTKEQVGLGNVDNTSDADKPLSTAAIAEIAGENRVVTLTNTEKQPFNSTVDDPVTVALDTARKNLYYTVEPEVTANTGLVGEIQISAKALNGFKIAYTGSGTSVTLTLRIKGGMT